MEKRALTAVLALITGIIFGILIGVGIIVLQVKNPLFGELFLQQRDILKRQEKIEQRLENIEKQGKELKDSLNKLKSQMRKGQDEDREDYAKVHNIDIAHSPVLGRKDAPVTIVEFIDIQCPFCARFHPAVLDTVKALPDKVNAVVKNFPLPFHKQAVPAAKAAFAAGEQGKYWQMLDILLKNNGKLDEKRFKDFAGRLGLDVKKFLKDYKEKDSQWQEYIQKDISLGNNVEVRGTPTIYINGRKTKARDVDSFKAEIERILKTKEDK